MSDKLTIGRVEFGNPAKAAAVASRVRIIKADKVKEWCENDHFRNEIAYMYSLMQRHKVKALKFAQELALT